MIKYLPSLTDIVLEEIPDKVSLAVEISNCQGSCIGCHSPFLKQDIGEELSTHIIDKLIADNFGINCFLFLGEGKDQEALLSLAQHIREHYPHIETALYSGRKKVEDYLFDTFDYIKIGPYLAQFGPLNSPTTNQRLYHHRRDITARFHNR